MNIHPRQSASTNDTLSASPASSFLSTAAKSTTLARAGAVNDTNSDAASAAPSSASVTPSAAASSSPHSDAPRSSAASISPSSPSSPPPKSSQPPPPSSSDPQPSSSAPPNPSSGSLSPGPSSSANPLTLFQSVTASTTDSSTITSSANLTTFVTEINGQPTTVTTSVPTSLSTASSSVTAAQRTAIIAGATAGGVGLVLLLLGAVFLYKRHKAHKREFSDALGRVRREAHGAGGVGLLDEEGFDDDDALPMRRYRDNAVSQQTQSRSASSLGPPQSPAPSLFRQRAENGLAVPRRGRLAAAAGHALCGPARGRGDGRGPVPHHRRCHGARRPRAHQR
ncbi:hypothetical protein C8R46DRAFT_9090 [Mycena filopes]|nr:hypothetical protein C8R46DRAFT_9090 [Mycena filopes]